LKKVIEHKNFIYNLFETYLIVRRIEKGMIKTVFWSSCRVPIIHVRFQLNFNFLDRFSKITQIQISNFIEICPVGAELFYVDRQA